MMQFGGIQIKDFSCVAWSKPTINVLPGFNGGYPIDQISGDPIQRPIHDRGLQRN
jgi:hypothetical protein